MRERERENRESVSVHRCEVSSIRLYNIKSAGRPPTEKGGSSTENTTKPKFPIGAPLWRFFSVSMLYDLTDNGAGAGVDVNETRRK